MAEAVQPTRRERRRQEVRERILDAAAELFERSGYEATTVNEIAQVADIAYGTFFNHFPSKLELLRELTNRLIGELFEEVEAVRPGQATPAGLVLIFEQGARRAEETGALTRDYINTMVSQGGPETTVVDDKQMRALFRDYLEQGCRSGAIRGDVELEVLTEVVVGTWSSMFLSWAHDPSYPLLERASATARFLADTLTPPGA